MDPCPPLRAPACEIHGRGAKKTCGATERHRGVRPGKRVGLFMGRSELAVVAILACLESGAANVPIDPGHPEERVRQIIAEPETATILTEAATLERARQVLSGEIIALDAQAAAIGSAPGRVFRSDTGLSPRDLCHRVETAAVASVLRRSGRVKSAGACTRQQRPQHP
jgi:acyl-coenzyme A synthetase/AMP-(fatty) acid ligase